LKISFLARSAITQDHPGRRSRIGMTARLSGLDLKRHTAAFEIKHVMRADQAARHVGAQRSMAGATLVRAMQNQREITTAVARGTEQRRVK
jgi:hypothetical protein